MRAPVGRAWPVLQAVGAFTLTAAMLGGVPYALAVFTGWPLPRRLPAWAGIRVFLTSPLTNDAIIKGLACLVWVLWLTFTLSVIMEVAAVARGSHAPRLPVIAPVQGFAAALVSAVLLTSVPLPQPAPRAGLHAVLAARAMAAPLLPDDPALAAPAAVLAAAQDPGGHDLAASRHAPKRPRVYRVVEGDNLWDIAVRFLGDGERWHEIYDLNRGKPQPDGGRLADPDLIYPGWVLALPARPAPPAGHHPSAGSRPATPPASRPPVPDHDRGPGPHTGKAGQHQRLPGPHTRTAHPAGHVPAHPRRERPGGVHLPDGGLVGITLAAAISAALVAWRLHRRRVAVPRWPIPDERTEPPLPEAICALRRAHLRSLAADAAEARGEPWPDDAEPGDMIPGPGGTGDEEGLDEFGAPAAAGWQPGSPVSGDAQHLAAPGTSAASGAASVPLSAPLTSPGPAWPGETDRDQLAGTLRRDEEREPPAPPARPHPAGTVVFGTRGSAEIPLTAVAARGLGLTGPGAHSAARALLIGMLAAPGPGGHAPALVIIPAADVRQLTGEDDPAMAQVPGVTPGLPDGLVITPTLAAALDRAETEITRRLRLREAGDDSRTSPGGPAADDSPPSPLALIASADAPSVPRIRAILDAGASAGITGILLGDWPSGITCHIGAGGEVTSTSDPGLAGAWASHLTPADTAAMLSMLRGAQGHLAADQPRLAETSTGQHAEAAGTGQPSGAPRLGPGSHGTGGGGIDAVGEYPAGDAGPGGDGASRRPVTQPPRRDPEQPLGPASAVKGPVDDSAGHGDAAPGSRAPAATMVRAPSPASSGKTVRICVLGRLRITARGEEISGGLRKARELLAYLAVHPEGATSASIDAELWPESSPRYAASQRHLAMRKAREMLRTSTGLTAPMFITLASERYRLDPALIEVDLWQFDAALARAQAAASGQDQLAALRQAISLYQGPLADGAAYEWAERHAEPARRRAVDALARIAGILQPGQPEQALATLETALSHDPFNEALYQAIMRIQARLGRPDAARRTLALLESRLAAIGLAPATETRQAAGVLLGRRSRHPADAGFENP
jgi:DNA-binding SARP family transcriptional activator